MRKSALILAFLFVFTGIISCAQKPAEAIDSGETKMDMCSSSVVKIKELIRTSKSCEKDSDCEFMGIACSMGCPVVNKKAVPEIKDLLASRGDCMCTMEACMPPPKVGCVQGQCKAL